MLSYEYSLFVVVRIYQVLVRKRALVSTSVLRVAPKKNYMKRSFQVIATLIMPLTASRLLYFFIRDFELKRSKEYFFRTRIDTQSKSYVFFGPIDWEYRKQRPQNIAKCLSEVGKDVFYINPTVWYHSKPDAELAFKKIDGINVLTFHSNYCRRSFYIGVKFIPQELAREFARLVENMLAKSANFSTTIIIQQPGWWNLAQYLQGNQLVFDCMDLHSGFEEINEDIDNAEQVIDILSDQIIVTSSKLLELKKIAFSEKTTLIRNGVDLSVFPLVAEIGIDAEVVVGYFGAIAEWFDTELLGGLAKKNPNIRFEIIGLVSDTRVLRELSGYSNIVFFGEVPNHELPSRIIRWRAGLIPFKITPLIRATNPVKMYEYAASGLPVLATAIPEVENIANTISGIYSAETIDEFHRNLMSALELPFSERQQLREWAKTQSWEHRIKDLLNAIDEGPKVSVIVLMWNQGILTMNCLKSIFERSDYINMEVILVDNGSNPEESAIVNNWIKNENGNQTKYVLNEENLGFAAGNNVGIMMATGDFVVLLNNDTEVTPGWIWRAIKHFSMNPRLGLLGPSTNNCGNEARIVLRNKDGNWLQEVIPRFGLRELRAIPATTAAFFCVFISRAALDEIGLISEEYGRGYFEDDDYCRRAQAAGYEISIARDIFVYHQMSASFDLLGDSAKAELFKANKAVYESKWGQWIPHTYTFDEDQR